MPSSRALVCWALLALPALTPSTGAAAEPTPRAPTVSPHASPHAFRRPVWIGVTMSRAPGEGVAVDHVVRGSPAERGGVRAGDRIVSIDGARVRVPSEVSHAVAGRRAGETLVLSLARKGSHVRVSVTLSPRPSGDEILRMDLVGAFAPAWTNVTPLSGAPSSLAKLRGRVVVVDFWASWCGPCRALAPRLSALEDRFRAQGLTVVGITTDSAERAAVFAQRHQMRYGVVVDSKGDTTRRYGIVGLPTMLLIDKRGVVRDVRVGFDPGGAGALEHAVRELLAEPAPAHAK